MVQVINTEPPVEQATGVISQMIHMLKAYWGWFLAFAIIIICIVVAYYFYSKRQEAERERDEPGYQLYKAVVASCMLQADHKKIKKRYRMINLLWLGIPFLWKERSVRVVNYSDQIIGYYRGAYESMDSTLNLLLYKKKIFGLIERRFILKVPLTLKFSKKEKPKGKKESEDNQAPVSENFSHLNLADTMIHYMTNGDIKLYCSSIEKIATYYFCPVFEINTEFGKLDYRGPMENIIADNTYQVMVQRLINVGARQLEKGIMMNPSLQYNMKSPTKTKSETFDDYDAGDKPK